MKKVLFTGIALVALASAGFAQNNVTTLSQNGAGNNSGSTQTGMAQDADINQIGTGNKSTTSQIGQFKQEVDVIQNGNNNTARSNQNAAAGLGNFVLINQTTTGVGGNTATADQSGKNMEATISQSGNATNGLAVVKQSGPLTGPNTGAAGDGQVAFIIQVGGNNNRGFITQESDFGMGADNTARIEQSGGDNNLATINQLMSVGFNENATIKQVGNRNTGLIQQDNYFASAETANLTQTGDDNRGFLRQDVQSASFVVNNRIDATQNGNRNLVDFRQGNGSNNTATLSQTGDDNIIKGLPSSSSPAIAVQLGETNTLTVTQTGTFQTAQISQIGTGNIGTVGQGN